jgi:hypothetical protein
MNDETHMTWFNGKNNIETMNNLVVFAQHNLFIYFDTILSYITHNVLLELYRNWC